MKALFLILTLSLSFLAAAPPYSRVAAAPPTAAKAESYQVRGSQILKNGAPMQWRGVNVLHVFGLNNLEMKGWNVDIVRVVVTNMRDNPLQGGVQKVGNSWLHSLQEVVRANRAYGRVVILCHFGWDDGPDSLFLGKNPSQVRWWNEYLAKYREWAAFFKDDPGVWFDLWNEPYSWDGKNGYSHDLWLSDAQKMVDNIRKVAPRNIILVPGGKECGDEAVIVHKGPELLKGRSNLVFDIHAYNSWLPDSQQRIEERIRAVQDKGCALLFGETGTTNAGYEMDPNPFLKAVSHLGISTLAWIWKQDPHDGNALLGSDDTPSEAGKYHWGKTFYDFLHALHTAEDQNGKRNGILNIHSRGDIDSYI